MSYVWSVVHLVFYVVFFFKQKTAYEMRISDWSSDVCSSDLLRFEAQVYLFQNLVPNAGMEVSDQIATFVENARSMTGIGTLALLVTALLLLSTINGAFNAIWRVTEPRPLMMPDGLLDDSDHQPAAARCVVVAHQLRLRQRGDGAGRARLRPDAPAALPVCHRRLHAALRGGAGAAGGIPQCAGGRGRRRRAVRSEERRVGQECVSSFRSG